MSPVRSLRRGTLLVIEERQGLNGPWTEVWATDEMANDYAFTQRNQMLAHLLATWSQRHVPPPTPPSK